MRLRIALAAAFSAVALVVPACGGGTTNTGSAEDYPSETLDWTVAFGPGGGNDLMARKLVQILSLIHISEPTRLSLVSRMPSSA